jgi:hypothetical protein
MNLNPEYNSQKIPSALEGMKVSMQWIWENFVEPRKSELTAEDTDMISMVGTFMLEVADRATAYDKLQNEENYFSKN